MNVCEEFLRGWLGINETVASVSSARRRASKAIDKEIVVQDRKKSLIESQIKKLESDKKDVAKVLAELRAEKSLLTSKVA